MSYQVFARKYRPQNFDSVIGQEHITQTLKNAIEQNRLAHAYLFVGPRGTGKTSTARILAKALNCVNGPTINPCGVCDVCREIAQGNSLDVLEIDGASNNGVEQVRELRENVRFAPTRGKYKIYIIDEVHMLTSAAFNALLKTLEEPPEHVKFVFATTEPQKVLPTILSRC
ncbi:MAG: DNA polymerase III subunit gamma/tau, partial [Verrucomicrobiota bacterium]